MEDPGETLHKIFDIIKMSPGVSLKFETPEYFFEIKWKDQSENEDITNNVDKPMDQTT